MPVLNSITEISKDMTEWRRYLHSIPELSFNEIKTSLLDFLTDLLQLKMYFKVISNTHSLFKE